MGPNCPYLASIKNCQLLIACLAVLVIMPSVLAQCHFNEISQVSGSQFLRLRPIMGRKKPWHDIKDPEVDRLVLGRKLGVGCVGSTKSER
jgi:hypothetical protein